jgi:hypothetical protein
MANETTVTIIGTVRLIQDSIVDLVRCLLSCNDQSSTKIAE